MTCENTTAKLAPLRVCYLICYSVAVVIYNTSQSRAVAVELCMKTLLSVDERTFGVSFSRCDIRPRV